MPLDSLGYTAPVGYVETKIVDADGEVLRRAADIIEQRGWVQRAYGLQGGPVCATAAIMLATNLSGSFGRCRDRVQKFIGVSWLTAWNDFPGRTKEEVIAALRSAAEQGAS